MAYKHLDFAPLDIGGNLIATEAWVNQSPIVLIAAHGRGKDGIEVKSRLDLQKRVFIDPMPGERTPADIAKLISRVLAASAQPGHEPPAR